MRVGSPKATIGNAARMLAVASGNRSSSTAMRYRGSMHRSSIPAVTGKLRLPLEDVRAAAEGPVGPRTPPVGGVEEVAREDAMLEHQKRRKQSANRGDRDSKSLKLNEGYGHA